MITIGAAGLDSKMQTRAHMCQGWVARRIGIDLRIRILDGAQLLAAITRGGVGQSGHRRPALFTRCYVVARSLR